VKGDTFPPGHARSAKPGEALDKFKEYHKKGKVSLTGLQYSSRVVSQSTIMLFTKGNPQFLRGRTMGEKRKKRSKQSRRKFWEVLKGALNGIGLWGHSVTPKGKRPSERESKKGFSQGKIWVREDSNCKVFMRGDLENQGPSVENTPRRGPS